MVVWVSNLSRNVKRMLALTADIITLPLALWLAFTLRLEEVYSPDGRMTTTIVLTTLTSVAVFIRLGLYRAVIRYAGLQLFNTIFVGTCISVFLFAFLGFLFQAHIPRSVPFIFFGIALIAISSSRLLIRHFLSIDFRETARKVFVYGAGSAGVQLSNALSQGLEYQAIAFIDDDKYKQGSVINGLRVHKPRHLPKLMSSFEVDEVLLAISSISPARRGEIVSLLGQYGARVKTIPGMLELIDGSSKIQEIRDLKVEELLGRDQVIADPQLLESCIKDKSVLVTGAGGSIGSELCRQIAALGPARLILFELSEFALYSIEQELEAKGYTFPIMPILGNVQDESRIQSIMNLFSIETVYHAAAYKHVPLVEKNLATGAMNNVLGTYSVANAAIKARVSNFILISTDKAVRPTNFMGATKRLAEQVLQNFAEQKTHDTRFCMVRFGNVLGSSGSVVPLFKSQIENGGPVTVTHPEITRFFMTIPEAVQLVIQAGTLSKGGDVFVLDMGEPVKILSLAETLIHLLGKTIKSPTHPDGDIEIRFTGLRPGEKLYEELLIGENCVGTEHPMITRAVETKISQDALNTLISLLKKACSENRLADVVKIVKSGVPEYTPANNLYDATSASQDNSKVINLNKRPK